MLRNLLGLESGQAHIAAVAFSAYRHFFHDNTE